MKKSRSVTDVFYTDRTMKVLFYSEIFADKNQYDLWKFGTRNASDEVTLSPTFYGYPNFFRPLLHLFVFHCKNHFIKLLLNVAKI